MRKILLTALFLQTAYMAGAQDYKIFIDNDGKEAEIGKATSYITVKQVADTAWFMQQFDLENAILQSGTFKDRNLQTPNGKFLYYRKLDFYNDQKLKDLFKSDTTNSIMTEGEFRNGKKEGKWTNYLIGGKKREEAFYKNGVLNGPYRSYNDDHTTIALSGNYVNGKREGEWDMYGQQGKVIEKDSYRNGKVYNKKMTLAAYNPPKAPRGFETYVTRELEKFLVAHNMGKKKSKYDIEFTVTTEGKVIRPEVTPAGDDDDPIAKALIDIVEKSPRWRPGNTGDSNKPHEDFATVSVEIKNDGVITKLPPDYPNSRAAYYYLNH
jgi:antitoxin component YwqK of YwqJK toxin-antitoxin module